MLTVSVDDFKRNYHQPNFPCLLEHINSTEHYKDIILATGSNGDYVRGMVLRNDKEIRHFSVGEHLNDCFRKEDYRYFYGQLILTN